MFKLHIVTVSLFQTVQNVMAPAGPEIMRHMRVSHKAGVIVSSLK